MADRTSDRIQLFAFGTGWGLPFATSAPFPLKLATWLRMGEIPFDFVVANDPSKGPKGKSPWIEHGSVRMGDSTLIIEYLQERFRSAHARGALPPVLRAPALLRPRW
jgi:glutathione S-transferase